MDVIHDHLDNVRLSNRSNGMQLATTLGAQLDIDFENPLEALCPGKRS